MSSPKIEFTGVRGDLLEGPHWMDDQQKLLFCSIREKRVHIWDPTSKQLDTVTLGSTVGFVVPHSRGGYVAGVGKQLQHFLWDQSHNPTVLAKVDEGLNNRFNDGKCDPQGRVWGGTCSLDQGLHKPLNAGSLYRFDGSGRAVNVQDQYNISNGLAWASDGKKFFHADSLFPSCVYVFDYNPSSGDAVNRRILRDFSDTPNARPDGMTIDIEGKLWLALHGQAKIVQLDPSTGQTIREVEMPLQNVTSCTFGGPNLDELYVTSMLWDEKDPPDAGSLMRVTGLGAKGLPATVYRAN